MPEQWMLLWSVIVHAVDERRRFVKLDLFDRWYVNNAIPTAEPIFMS
jgi:hypothetical protein